jgi:hypothetical protein
MTSTAPVSSCRKDDRLRYSCERTVAAMPGEAASGSISSTGNLQAEAVEA